MTDSNDRVRRSRGPAATLRSVLRSLPGAASNAPKRNALVVVLYAFAVLLVAGGLWVRL